jgi:hypothetical protein
MNQISKLEIANLVIIVFALPLCGMSVYSVISDDVWQAFKYFIISWNLLFISVIINTLGNGKNSKKESTLS